MIRFIQPPDDTWFFSEQLSVWQKVQGDVFVYVTRNMGYAMVQLYRRGYENMAYCTLELRSKQYSYDRLFAVGQEWLDRYQLLDGLEIRKDYYHIDNPEGAWGSNGQAQGNNYID